MLMVKLTRSGRESSSSSNLTVPAAKVKLMVEQILQRILEGEFNYDNVMKLTDDSTLGESDVKACIAVLHFFIASSAKFDVEESTLARELQQLGLPKEQSDAVARPYWENKEALQSKFLQQSLQCKLSVVIVQVQSPYSAPW
jgi:hypothetical protein